ncbi:hypothetical protein VM1G_11050 [Cytospora mali]|nr:hypothetical protein VM1G_11050 [Valsa mali]
MSTNGTHVQSDKALFDLSKYPPFPSGLPTVNLETISLSQLEKGDKEVEDRVFQICKERGFFYLDFNGSNASFMQSDADAIARLAEKVFRLPNEENEKYPMDNSLFGFKRVGATKADAQGTPDTARFFNVAKDAILENTDRWPLPQLILDQKPVLERFMRQAHGTGLEIMSLLATRIGLPPDAFDNLHRITEESGDHVRMTHAPPRMTSDMPEVSNPSHTDFGTITFLFNWLGGLQVWSDPSRGNFENLVDPEIDGVSEKPRWLWVRPPPPNHAIVNLGDAAVKWTGGVLCSGRHRVVPAPGEQGLFDRYSVVYFVRPEDNALLKRLEAPGIPKYEPGKEEAENMTAKQWIFRQSRGLGHMIVD